MVTLQLRQLDVPPGQSLLLHDVNWTEFEAILEELGQHRHTRIAYEDGLLEIMAPLSEHEYLKETLGDALKDIAEELNQNYESYGSTTWRKPAKQAGLEPDNCFYFQNEALVRGKLDFDLTQDPPPDLALEIDITSKSLARLPIYVRLGVPEIWCYDQGQLRIYLLQQDQYVEAERSQIFSTLKVQELPKLIEENRDRGRIALRRAVRQWVREQAG
jgi:Uma2 family endonuclease